MDEVDRMDKKTFPSLLPLWRALAFVLALAVLLLHARAYLPFIADDALISLRYARRLLQGHGLTWTPGERVEGYSNLLWILGCAGLGGLGVDLILAARVLGLLGMGAALGAIAFSARRGLLLPPLAGMLLFALADPVACWSIGGLEQGWVAGLLAWALVLSEPLAESRAGQGWRRALAPGVLLGLLNLARPDGPLFTVAIVGGILLAPAVCGGGRLGHLRLRARAPQCRPGASVLAGAVALAAVSALFFLGQLVFRRAYYHEWLPNTAFVKLQLSPARVAAGWAYFSAFARSAPWFLAFAAASGAACLAAPSTRRRAVGPCLVFLLWASYLVFIGGDIFPVHRHAVPLLVCLALLVTPGLERALEACRGPVRRRLLALATGLLLAALAFSHLIVPRGQRPLDELWEWDGKIVGEMLQRTFGDRQPLLAVDAAGCLPYFSGLPSLDMLGLNDKHIARHRRPGYQPGKLAHDLGDGQYVFDRKPDLFIFNSPYGDYVPQYYSGAEMVLRQPEFKRLYKAATFRIAPGLPWRLVAYVRAEGGRIGIERPAGRVVVPGYLMMDNPLRSLVFFDARGRPLVEATPRQAAMYNGLALAPGTWIAAADADADDAAQTLVLGVDGREMALSPGLPAPSFHVGGATSATVNLLLKPARGRAGIRGLTLIKMPDPFPF